jgi:murein DD-endopeptidase MepM/ murein hydrolase activator NlpD
MRLLWSPPPGDVPRDGLTILQPVFCNYLQRTFLHCLFPLCFFVQSETHPLPRPQKLEAFQLEVSEHRLFPGDVLYLAIKADKTIQHAEASLAGRKVVFYPRAGGLSWVGLAGIDLETKVGRYTLNGTVSLEGGAPQTFARSLSVAPKSFPVQRISVEEKYVTLSPEDSKRAEEENKRLETLWQTDSISKLWQGPFLKPVASDLTSGFGRRRIVNNKPRNPHSGVDLKADTGTPILAANSGRVALAEDLFFSGNTVVLDHGQGLYTFYGHCSKLFVSRDDLVKKGEIIAEVGSSGRVTGPHLHWACRISGARVDPIKLTKGLIE